METLIENVITGKVDYSLLVRWLNNENIEDTEESNILLCCTKSEFVAYFLSFLRNQTESILQTNSSVVNLIQHQSTPEKLLNRNHHRSISDPTNNAESESKTDGGRNRSHNESPSRKKTDKRKVKTQLFNSSNQSTNPSISSDESKVSSGMERLFVSSTPLKGTDTTSPCSPCTPGSQSRSFHEPRRPRSHEKTFNLGDYLATAQVKSSKKKRVVLKSLDEPLDLNDAAAFPEIGRKSSSFKSDKRRIKPTNIDSTPQKSRSLNSFNSDAFQMNSPLVLEENQAFKLLHTTPKESFEAERSILKSERHKLMEKFSVLSTTQQGSSHIKLRKDTAETHSNIVTADVNSVVDKETLDTLVGVYEILIRKDLVASVANEIYFLISLLLSDQNEEDYAAVEGNKSELATLKQIHNCTYFAAKSLWHQRAYLEFMLDRSSLKILGENRKVRNFCPELAKCLLNVYGMRSEGERERSEVRASEQTVCFNSETDNSDNFPSLLSFQNFKKQRDMFYEILRWYADTPHSSTTQQQLRARIKALTSTTLAIFPANYSHLARLVITQLITECGRESGRDKESRLSKLQRRLFEPAGAGRRGAFDGRELFYKQFVLHADCEPFRAHLRDRLAAELRRRDAAPLADDRGHAPPDPHRDYVPLARALRLLAKYLGLLAAAPYAPTDAPTPVTRAAPPPPKQRVCESELAVRDWTQPNIDLQTILNDAAENGRLCITIPWLTQYLAMLDYTTLRTEYYQRLLKTLFSIYRGLSSQTLLKRNTVIFLKLTLNFLFDMPQFPQELFYSDATLDFTPTPSEDSLDSLDLIDESVVLEVCPFLKDINSLLLTSKPGQVKGSGSFRHITPVSLSLNPEERVRSKEKEIQARLSEAYLKSQPASTRRVLDLSAERIAAAAARAAAGLVRAARGRARAKGRGLAAGSDWTHYRDIYQHELVSLRKAALEAADRLIEQRSAAALDALLAPGGNGALVAVLVRSCRERVRKWIGDNWNSTDFLCKDIAAEFATLQSAPPAPEERAAGAAGAEGAAGAAGVPGADISPAAVIIELKEQICLLLDYESTSVSPAALAACAALCGGGGPQPAAARRPAVRAALQLSLDLCVVCVSRIPNAVTDQFLDQFLAVWRPCCPESRAHDAQTQPDPVVDAPAPPAPDSSGCELHSTTYSTLNSTLNSTANSTLNSTANSQVADGGDSLVDMFDRILCSRNIMILTRTRSAPRDVWAALARLLVRLLRGGALRQDALTEQCLAAYRQDWPPSTLEGLSWCARAVAARWPAEGKFTLFMEFLSEFCGDLGP